jgi:hypothetical protein
MRKVIHTGSFTFAPYSRSNYRYKRRLASFLLKSHENLLKSQTATAIPDLEFETIFDCAIQDPAPPLGLSTHMISIGRFSDHFKLGGRCNSN